MDESMTSTDGKDFSLLVLRLLLVCEEELSAKLRSSLQWEGERPKQLLLLREEREAIFVGVGD